MQLTFEATHLRANCADHKRCLRGAKYPPREAQLSSAIDVCLSRLFCSTIFTAWASENFRIGYGCEAKRYHTVAMCSSFSRAAANRYAFAHSRTGCTAAIKFPETPHACTDRFRCSLGSCSTSCNCCKYEPPCICDNYSNTTCETQTPSKTRSFPNAILQPLIIASRIV